MAYAATTSVAVSKTKGEIDAMLRKHKATGFGSFEEAKRAIIIFEMANRRIRFELPLPDRTSNAFTRSQRGMRSADAALAAWEQACRSRWRALFLCIKAKLESIESGIESFDDAFLAHIQMPDGRRVGDVAIPQLRLAYETNTMQPLLPAPKAN